jgi:pyridoxamine 5'-phosphate oxidase
VVHDREALDARFAGVQERFPDGTMLPPPPHWGGYRVAPDTVEFWQGRSGRMHDRLRYRRSQDADDDAEWIIERLAP